MTIPIGAQVWRDYQTDGVPASGANNPVKRDIRALMAFYETVLNGGGGPGLGYATLALLNADLAHGANSLAIVYGDSTAANNGLYQKAGASGSGSWTRVGDLPATIVPLTVTGGTANAIIATAPQTPLQPGAKLFLLTPTAANTSTTTIAINGLVAVEIKSALGNSLVANSLLSGSQVLMAWSVDHYQLLISVPVDASGILASAIAAQTAASASATSASGYSTAAASSASALGNQVHQYDTRALAAAATIPVGVQAIKVTRYAAGYPLSYATYIPGTSAGPMAFAEAGGHYWQLDLSGGVADIAWFGGMGDGATDNAAAFNAWWASLPASGGSLLFGPGKFVFGSAISKTMAAGRQAVTIKGSGSDLTILYWAAGGGMQIIQGSSLNTVHIRDLTFSTGAVGAGSGLYLDSAGIALGIAQLSDITNVIFRGDDFDDISANSKYWSIGLKIKGWSSINIYGLTTYGLIGAPGTAGGGVGFDLSGYSGSAQAVVINIHDSSFSWHNVHAQLNSYWEGITFSQCNFQGEVGSVGIYCPTGQTNCGPLLTVIGSQFNTAGQQVDLVSAVPQFIFQGNCVTTYGNSNQGLLLGTGASPIITGNLFNLAFGTGTTAIAMNGANGIIQGNIFIGVANGVVLNPASANVNVSQNRYSGVTTPVTNSGTGNSVGAATN